MGLFGSGKDISFFRSINRELIHDIISIEVDIFKLVNEETKSNIYGESDSISYYQPIRIPCLIRPDDQASEYTDFGYDSGQQNRFAFLRDDLKDRNILMEPGDLIDWNNNYWEIDHLIENQLYMKRNPETNKSLDIKYGWDVSISCIAHLTRRNRPNIEETRFGES